MYVESLTWCKWFRPVFVTYPCFAIFFLFLLLMMCTVFCVVHWYCWCWRGVHSGRPHCCKFAVARRRLAVACSANCLLLAQPAGTRRCKKTPVRRWQPTLHGGQLIGSLCIVLIQCSLPPVCHCCILLYIALLLMVETVYAAFTDS